MEEQIKKYMVTAFVLMAIAVILGAFGAHALKERLSSHYLEVWETANKYHMIHGLGIALIAGFLQNDVHPKYLTRIFILMITGIILFSGSLYLLSIADLLGTPSLKKLGAITPIGGVLFVSGWLNAAYVLFKKSRL